MTLLISQRGIAQFDNIKSSDGFYFYYSIAGLSRNFSNLKTLLPTLRIYNRKFIYTKEQNNYWHEGQKKKQTISKGKVRQSSIDSILLICQKLKDTTIYKTNPCIMIGTVTNITIAYKTDTTKFILHNTFDSTALKIIEVLNPYLPKDEKLYGSVEEIKKEVDCWTDLRNKAEQMIKDSTKVK